MARTRGIATAGAQPSVEARGQSEELVVAVRNDEETRGEVGGVRVRAEGGSGHVGLWQGCSEAQVVGRWVHRRLKLAGTDAGV